MPSRACLRAEVCCWRTGVQFLLVLIGSLDVPLAGLGREIGAYLALLASAAAVIPVAGRSCARGRAALTGAAYAARWRASAAGVRPESRPHSLVRWAWSA